MLGYLYICIQVGTCAKIRTVCIMQVQKTNTAPIVHIEHYGCAILLVGKNKNSQRKLLVLSTLVDI